MNDDHNDRDDHAPRPFLSMDDSPDTIRGSLEDLEADLDGGPGEVLTSAVELGVDSGWTTSQMTGEELARIVGTDIRGVGPEGDASSNEADLWTTTKMDADHDHLLALSNPARVPDPQEQTPHGATMKMTDEEMRRAVEDSSDLEHRAPDAPRPAHSTPVERPHGRLGTLRPDIPASQNLQDAPRARAPGPGARHARAKRRDPWSALALASLCVLIALSAYLGLR